MISASAIRTVFQKELTDMLRDRRAIISMIVVPLLVMPAIVFGFLGLSVNLVDKAKEEVQEVAVLGAAHSPAFLAEIARQPRLKLVEAGRDWRRRIGDKSLRAVVQVPDDFDQRLEAGREAAVVIHHYAGDLKSGIAADALERALSQMQKATTRAKLEALQVSLRVVEPFTISKENAAPPEKVGGAILGSMIPYFLLMLCVTGAMYPAMDLTAGEKERGTLETLLCSPVGRLELVLGKYLVVLVSSFVTCLFAVCSFGASVLAVRQALPASLAQGAEAMSLSLPGFAASLALILPLGALLSALLLAFSLFARSFKEAQSYVSPVLFLVIFGAMGAMLPGMELTWGLSCVPVLNVSLASREVLTGIFPWPKLALILGTTLLYATLGLTLCVRMFRRESVLFRQ